MNQKKKEIFVDPEDGIADLEASLPPLDHDEVEQVDPEQLADLVDDVDGDEPLLSATGDQPIEDEIAFAQELIEPVESTWTEKDEKRDQLEVDFGVDEAEDEWSGGENDSSAALDDDWFVDDEELEGPLDSDDAEGPLHDSNVDLNEHRAHWDDLGDEADGDDADEEILDVMERLGIDLPSIQDGTNLDSVPGMRPGILLDRQFLGPAKCLLTAAAFAGGSPIAVGGGLFVLGADGMLHPTIESQRLGETVATSVCAHGESIFIGTRIGGALVTRDKGQTLTAINSWYTHGLGRDERTSIDRLSTRFEIHGCGYQDGYRLIGHTGEGQIFASTDGGRTWNGPLIGDRCLALATVAGDGELVGIVDAAGEISLIKFKGVEEVARLSLPESLATAIADGGVVLGAGVDTVMVASPPVMPHCSLDGGQTWSPVEGIGGVTALAFDPADPGWIAAATHNSTQGLGVVRFSEDSGRNWSTAITLGGVGPSDPGLPAEHRGKILQLVVDDEARARRVIAVTAHGLYQLTLARPGISH